MATGDLTTLSAVKQWLPVASTTTSADATLQALISACSADFTRATRRPDLLSESYAEVRQGDGASRICLYHWPITAVETLAIGGVAASASGDKVAPGYYFDDDIDPERAFNLYLNPPGCFTDGAAIQIAYTAGYTAVPYDIAQAVADWVAYRYKQLPNLGAAQRKTTEGETVQQQQLDAPATALACIDRYMRRIPSISRRYDEEQAWARVKAPRSAGGKR
jgi:hypothetical protein